MLYLDVFLFLLYYGCLLAIAHGILGRAPRRPVLACSFLVFIPMLAAASTMTRQEFVPVSILFLVLQFPLVKLIFPGIRLSGLAAAYTALQCVSIVLCSLTSPALGTNYSYLELAINVVVTISCMVMCLSRARIYIRQMVELTPRHTRIITMVLLVFAASTSILFWGAAASQYGAQRSALAGVGFVCLLLAICLLLPMLLYSAISANHMKMVAENYERQIHVQAEHYRQLADANYEVRRFRHDFRNMSIAIGALLSQGENQEAVRLLRQCGEALEAPGGSQPSFDTGNGIADALLTEKRSRAEKFGADILFEGAIPPSALSPVDLCVMLGNTLDNALEACQKLPGDARKTISVTCRSVGGFLLLSIQNPLSEKVAIKNGRISTTKENKTLHGFGLYSLHSMVRKYDGEVRLSATDERFTVEIDLCISNAQNCRP